MSTALRGIRVLEMSGIGPAPYAAMVLGDWGARVIRIDRPQAPGAGVPRDVTSRGKTSLIVDMKEPAGLATLRKLVSGVDVLIDPYRPGVMEKAGLGPEECHQLNPRLIYARMVGFPRDSAYGKMAGHDLNYISVSGVLHMLRGRDGDPIPPANILGDFAGGGGMLVQGILLALFEREKSGKGQVVNTDMVNGARYISSFPLLLNHPVNKRGNWHNPPGKNLLDGGSPFYTLYKTQDGGWMSVACLEPQFFRAFAERVNKYLPDGEKLEPKRQADLSTWPGMKEALTRVFATKTRADWTKVFHETDACCVPMLSPDEVGKAELGEADTHPQGRLNPAPHPRLSRTPAGALKEYKTEDDFYVAAGQEAEKVIEELSGVLGEEEKSYLRRKAGAAAKL